MFVEYDAAENQVCISQFNIVSCLLLTSDWRWPVQPQPLQERSELFQRAGRLLLPLPGRLDGQGLLSGPGSLCRWDLWGLVSLLSMAPYMHASASFCMCSNVVLLCRHWDGKTTKLLPTRRKLCHDYVRCAELWGKTTPRNALQSCC